MERTCYCEDHRDDLGCVRSGGHYVCCPLAHAGITIEGLRELVDGALRLDAADPDGDDEGAVNAENAVYAAYTALVGEDEEYDAWCLKATRLERLDEALNRAEGRPSPPHGVAY